MSSIESVLDPLFEAVAWVLMKIHALLAAPFGADSGVAWCLSIVILVVLMRLIMVPLFVKQVRSQQKMQKHMPQLQELRKRYKNDKQKLNEETMKFYKENGVNPLGGCLPLVAQLPVFWSLFNVLEAVAKWVPGQTPKYGLTVPVVQSALHAHVFGVLLSDRFLFEHPAPPLAARAVILVSVLVSACTTFLTMRQSQKRGMLQQGPPDPDNPMANTQKYMMYISPLFALSGLYWQYGLVIYWVTTNVWTLGQQFFLFRNLPIVGSTTVGASAVQAAGGGQSASQSASGKTASGSAKTAQGRTAQGRTAQGRTAQGRTVPAKNAPGKNVPGRTGPADRSGSAKTGAARTTGAAKTGAARTGTTSAGAAKDTAGGKGASPGGNAAGKTATGASNGSGTSGSAASSAIGRLRLGRSKPEPEPEPVAPQPKVVRNQPVKKSRSQRSSGNKR